MDKDHANLILPLASSYTTRGIAGFTNTVTNALDARKINAIYEPIRNSLTGNATLLVAKRPGVADVGSSYGTSGQVAYLWDVGAGAATNVAANRWVFSTSSNDIRASDTSTTTVIATAAGYAPAFVDKTAISGTDTLVVQLRHTDGTQTAWYSSAIGTFTQISDSTFTNLAHQGKMEHMNGYAFISTRNRIYGSDLNSVASWSDISFLDRQAKQDIGTGLAKLGKQIISFGTSTMEILIPSGQGSGLSLEFAEAHAYGLASTIVTGQRHYSATVDDRLFWVGANPGGVYTYNGQTVEKVSTLAIDKILAERQFYFVSSIGFQGQRALSIGLDTPDATTQRALWFFPRWNEWFEFTSTVWIPQASERLEGVCLGVGSNQHKLYAISQTSDNYRDAGTDYTLTLQFKIPRMADGWQHMRMYGVLGDTARSSSTLGVSVSDDDGQNWSSLNGIDMTSMKKLAWRGGSYRERDIRLTHTGNLDCRLESFIAAVE